MEPRFRTTRKVCYPVIAISLISFMGSHQVLAIEPGQGHLAPDVTALISEHRNQLKEGTAIDKRKGMEAAQVRALVAIIDGESKPGGNRSLKHRALRELERFPNSDEAISALLREIRFEPPQRFSKNPLATYTAADVLSKMGVRARTRLLKEGLGKPLSEPELYLRAVVLVMMDFDAEWKAGKEIALKRLRSELEVVEKEVVPPGHDAETLAAGVFNFKRMISLIDDPRFSAARIPDPDEPEK